MDAAILFRRLFLATIDALVELLKQTKAVGLILTNCISKPLLKRLGDFLPVVQCCECIPNLPYPFVTVNDIAAARNAVEYIVSLGKRRISFINGTGRFNINTRVSGCKGTRRRCFRRGSSNIRS